MLTISIFWVWDGALSICAQNFGGDFEEGVGGDLTSTEIGIAQCRDDNRQSGIARLFSKALVEASRARAGSTISGWS